MKKVSVYIKGNRNTPSYYRIYQYLDNIDYIKCVYHKMMSDRVYDHFMPVSAQSILIKGLIFLYSYFRMLYSLLSDAFFTPSYVVVTRNILSRYMPYSYKILLELIIRKGGKLIWDFDDHILNSKEITRADFIFLAKKSNLIIVTHDYLKSLIPDIYQDKVKILPTTDGDMYKLFKSKDVDQSRVLSIETEVRMVWVATSLNLINLESILQYLDEAAQILYDQQKKVLTLKVICNEPLSHSCKYLKVINEKWTRNGAINGMLQAHIGIMPLRNTVFAKGKGGFKLVQYLSVGLPCIGTNVGFNNHVIDDTCGYLIDVNDNHQWVEAILQLSDPKRWITFSKCAYNQWCKKFSYEENLKFWKSVFLS